MYHEVPYALAVVVEKYEEKPGLFGASKRSMNVEPIRRKRY